MLAGKRVIVTGAAAGLGAAIAIAFGEKRARIMLADIAPGDVVADRIMAMGGEAMFVSLDVTDPIGWDGIVAEAVDRWGGLDILINNAAVASGLVRIEDRSPEDWDRTMAVNAKGPFLATRAVLPVLRAGGGGTIVNVSSVAGLGQSQIMDPAYACSKAAMTMLTRITAAQHAADGIRCNSVHPGPIDSDLARIAYADETAFTRRLSRVPAGRLAAMSEVVDAILYLASDASSYITGTALAVDGGALVQ